MCLGGLIMELILDSANIEQIKELNELLTVTGVTTNPTIITKSGKEPEVVIKELIDLLDEDQLLFIQAVRTDYEGIMEEAKAISKLRKKNMYVKIPVTHEGLKAIKECKENFSGLIIAGKMHAAGVDEPVVDIPTIKQFIEAGADVILMPAAGTVPGLQESTITEACKIIKEAGCLSLSAIGTSQETSDTDTIRELALSSKRSGIDIQHIGDAGWGGMAFPENIMAMSVAIRGIRHTYFKMAQSAKR